MGVKVGDRVYCHTTGYFNGSILEKDIFAIKGNYYFVSMVNKKDNTKFCILNERGNVDHSWDLTDEFYEYFDLEGIKALKKISKFSLV